MGAFRVEKGFNKDFYEMIGDNKMSRICSKCRKKCEYRNVKFENVTLYLEENCAAEMKKECDEIATEEFRSAIAKLQSKSYKLAGVKGILTQAQCILNVADNKICG